MVALTSASTNEVAVYTAESACVATGWSRATLVRRCAAHGVEPVRVPGLHRALYRRDDLERMLRAEGRELYEPT